MKPVDVRRVEIAFTEQEAASSVRAGSFTQRTTNPVRERPGEADFGRSKRSAGHVAVHKSVAVYPLGHRTADLRFRTKRLATPARPPDGEAWARASPELIAIDARPSP